MPVYSEVAIAVLMRQAKESEESNMTKNKREEKWRAMSEACLMGITIPIDDDEQLGFITAYILNVLGVTITSAEVLKGVYKYNVNDAQVSHLVTNRIHDMPCITFVREDNSEFDLLDPNGVFCYVYNASMPDFSELGYSYFKADDSGFIRRIA